MPTTRSPVRESIGDSSSTPSQERSALDQPYDNINVPEISAATANIQKLPHFWSEQPHLWFIQIENIFTLAHITRDETKFSHVIANLDPTYLKFVGDILVSPPPVGKYNAIKERLISSFAVSEEAKLKKLFGGLVIGDQKPSHFLQSMKALAAGNNIGDNVLKTLFLDQLPDNIRSVLVTSNADLPTIAQQADKIMDIAYPQVSAISPTDNIIQELSAKIEALEKKIDLSSRRRSNFREDGKQRHRSKSRNRRSGWCWYHSRFEDRAEKCIPPCSYNQQSKN
ncbi:uncharacterized protein LOC135950795 [Calliphora vicina]|uniref:uncharacterized protein LOC135950795 n=1 Tax=Calliphora vicina TaxID=7373 RepID=UPI00325B0E21